MSHYPSISPQLQVDIERKLDTEKSVVKSKLELLNEIKSECQCHVDMFVQLTKLIF